MTNIRAESPLHKKASRRTSHDRAEQAARVDERRIIGQQLHQGILQELTVAGFRLRAMQDSAPEGSAAAISEFAEWLRGRQADLRQYVANLEQGVSGNRTELSAIASTLAANNVRVSFDERLQLALFAPQAWRAIVATLRDTTRVLSETLGAVLINVGIERDTPPALRISHDGGRLGDRTEELAAFRLLVGSRGASLRLEAAATTETLTLDWAD